MNQYLLLIFISVLLASCQKPETTIYVNIHSQLIFQKKDSLFITCPPISSINIGQFSSPQKINVNSMDIGCIDLEGNSANIELSISKVNNSFFLNYNDTCADNSDYSGEYIQLILEPMQWDSLKIHFARREEFDVMVYRHKTNNLSNNSNLLDFDSELLLFFNDKLNNDTRRIRCGEIPEFILYHKGAIFKKMRRGYLAQYFSNISKVSYSKFKYN